MPVDWNPQINEEVELATLNQAEATTANTYYQQVMVPADKAWNE